MLETLDGPAAPLTELSPKTAAEIVAGLTPSMRRKLLGWVNRAMRSHQANGRAAEARFCLVMLNALTLVS
ncbi:MAG: hypothetical protein U1E45_12295 [Geminicoccaceae bacterium]